MYIFLSSFFPTCFRLEFRREKVASDIVQIELFEKRKGLGFGSRSRTRSIGSPTLSRGETVAPFSLSLSKKKNPQRERERESLRLKRYKSKKYLCTQANTTLDDTLCVARSAFFFSQIVRVVETRASLDDVLNLFPQWCGSKNEKRHRSSNSATPFTTIDTSEKNNSPVASTQVKLARALRAYAARNCEKGQKKSEQKKSKRRTFVGLGTRVSGSFGFERDRSLSVKPAWCLLET